MGQFTAFRFTGHCRPFSKDVILLDCTLPSFMSPVTSWLNTSGNIRPWPLMGHGFLFNAEYAVVFVHLASPNSRTRSSYLHARLSLMESSAWVFWRYTRWNVQS